VILKGISKVRRSTLYKLQCLLF